MSVQIDPGKVTTISPRDLGELVRQGRRVELIDVLEPRPSTGSCTPSPPGWFRSIPSIRRP